MKLLLTGATGHSAKYFFHRLVTENWKGKIICPIRTESLYKTKKFENFGLDVNFIECDLQGDLGLLVNAMKNTDTVLHIAGIKVSERVVKAGQIAGVDWLICVHTTGRYSKFKRASMDYIRIEDKLIKELYGCV